MMFDAQCFTFHVQHSALTSIRILHETKFFPQVGIAEAGGVFLVWLQKSGLVMQPSGLVACDIGCFKTTTKARTRRPSNFR